jgi:6-phosphogluconolactonase
MDFYEAENADTLAQHLAQTIAQKLSIAIKERGTASLVLSGGSTPKPLFNYLSTKPIEWQKVVVSLADERWVPFEHEDSNERLVTEHLLKGPAAQATFCSLFDAASDTAEQGVNVIADRLSNGLARPITVVVLGMGSDGHTASLFPDTDGLDNAMALDNTDSVQIMRPQVSPHARITMTRRMLLDSEHRYLHITGQGKRDLLEEVVSPSGPDLPIAGFLDQPPITVYWSP